VGIPAALQERADALLAAHRQMVVLMTGERALGAADKRAVSAVGQMLFHDMQERQRALIAQAGEMTDPATVPALNALLDRIESEPSWFDADRLAFKEFLGELSTRYGAGAVAARPQARAAARAKTWRCSLKSSRPTTAS
jgi:hypothetical protein